MPLIRILGAIAILALSAVLLAQSAWIYRGRLNGDFVEFLRLSPVASPIMALAEELSIANSLLPLTNIAAMLAVFSASTLLAFVAVLFFLLRDLAPKEPNRREINLSSNSD